MRALIAVALASCMGLAWSSPQNIQKTHGNKQSAATEQRGTEKAPLFVHGEVTTKKDKAEAEADAKEQQHKVKTDEELVKYTKILAGCTFLLFVFTALLWIATYCLARDAKNSGRRQYIQTRKALRISKENADTAKDTVVQMKSTSERELRAYVGIDDIALKTPSVAKEGYVAWNGEAGYSFEDFLIPNIKNTGKTPAYNLSVWVNWQRVGYANQLPSNFDYADSDSVKDGGGEITTSRMVLAPDQSYRPLVAIPDVLPFKLAEEKQASLHFYGHIDYTDIYRNRWKHAFCFLWQPGRIPPDHLAYNGDYNREEYCGKDTSVNGPPAIT